MELARPAREGERALAFEFHRVGKIEGMRHSTYVCSAAAMAIGVAVAACSSSPSSSTATTTPQGTAPTTTVDNRPLQPLLPTPPNTARTDGPDTIHNDGIHMHFLVSGSPADVMAAYKTELEAKSWAVTVERSGGGGGGGGASYTGSNGGVYGVFTGGGQGNTTDLDACAWPSKPANTDCGSGNR